MKDTDEYRFVIDAYSPETLPMSRLAEYMTDLARLFGTAERVHFVRLEAGSTVLVQRVEPEARLTSEGGYAGSWTTPPRRMRSRRSGRSTGVWPTTMRPAACGKATAPR